MSFKAKLEVAGKKYNVLSVGYGLAQETDPTGRPSSQTRGGKIEVTVESTGETDLFYMFQDGFSKDMEELKTYVDSLNAPGQDFYYNQQKAINTIIKMQQTIPSNDSIARSLMYNNILLTNRKLIDAKKTIKTLGNSKEEIDELLTQLESYKKELEIVKRELEVCRLINKEK